MLNYFDSNNIPTDWYADPSKAPYFCLNNNVWDNWNQYSLGPINKFNMFPPKLITGLEPHYNIGLNIELLIISSTDSPFAGGSIKFDLDGYNFYYIAITNTKNTCISDRIKKIDRCMFFYNYCKDETYNYFDYADF